MGAFRITRGGLLLFLALAGPPCPLAGAQAPVQEPAPRISLAGPNLELTELVARVAHFTGTRIILDDALRGSVSLFNDSDLEAQEALEVMHAALLLGGFAAVPSASGGLRVVPIRDAYPASAWRANARGRGSDALVTALLRLDAAAAEDVAAALRPMIAERDQMVSIPRTNALLLATTEARLRRLVGLVRALDFAATTRRVVLALRHAAAVPTAERLVEALGEPDETDGGLRVIADERTNSLIVEASAERLERVRGLVAALDRPRSSKTGLHVVRVLDADAEALAEQLRALGSGASRTPKPGAQPDAAMDFDVVADGPTNSLVIRAGPERYAALSDVIAKLDRLPPRLAVDVQLLEVESNDALSLAFNAFLPLSHVDGPDDTIAFANVNQPTFLADSSPPTVPFVARITRTPVLVPFLGPGGTPVTVPIPRGGGEILAAEGDVRMRTLLHPHLLAASGEQQRLVVGDRVPIPISTEQVTSSTFTTGVAIQRQDVGIELEVRPVAVSDRVIEIELGARFSAIAPNVAAGGAGSTLAASVGPTLAQRELNAVLRLTDGAVAVVGSAPQPKQTTGRVGVPWLMDVPILGWLFRSEQQTERQSRLLFVVQATALGSPESQRAESIERRIALERHLLRTSPLRSLSNEPYALLVATRASRPEARSVAEQVGEPTDRVHVVEWRLYDAPRFDVYVTGFDDPSAAGPLAARLRAEGFQPRLHVAFESLTLGR